MARLVEVRDPLSGERLVHQLTPGDTLADSLMRLYPEGIEGPWRVYAGTLDVAGLAAVIEKCACNLSGDTGSLHLAMMTRAPAVAWFRAHKGEKEWIPEGTQYRVLVAPGVPSKKYMRTG